MIYKAICRPDLKAGQQLQLIVPGGYWKVTELIQGENGLLSEAATPGFDYQDMKLATAGQMKKDFPALWKQKGVLISTYCKE